MPFRHREIADDLRQQITTGRLGPGKRLSSEPALAAHYAVSTGTLRRALSVLQGEGLIEKFHGRGNYVRRPLRRFMYVGGWGTFDPWTAADASLRVTVRTAMVPAQGLLADLLDVPTGSPLAEFVCVSHEGASPLGLARIYLPHDLAPAGPLGEEPLYEQTAKRFAVLSSSPAEVRETVCARPPTPDEVSALRISPTATVLGITRTATDAVGRVVEAALLVFPGDRTDAVFITHHTAAERQSHP
ncbi:GntR family transcriptional regulator [Streptomyces sp. NPDC005576]|uniref:GntR family transcriptional regulator n=1 Tax=Streptomyces sp. NPDC005576 TaxID=3364726 RepID=UPI00367DBD98